MTVLVPVAILAGALPILGSVLWVGWGTRKLGVSLIGAGVLLAFLVMVPPVLHAMQATSGSGSDELVVGCWTWRDE